MDPLRLVLNFAFIVLVFPAVEGDCYDSYSNAKSYDNCYKCYETLANALMNSADNKYRLGAIFSPKDAAEPLMVEVTYALLDNATDECDNNVDKARMIWYWLMGEFYVYQPLDVFLYRSLFFNPPRWRQGSVILCLPEECFIMSNKSEEFFEFLTQRLPAYANYQTVNARVKEAYIGVAVRGDRHVIFGDEKIRGSRVKNIIVPLGYIVPFIGTFLILSMVACVSYYHSDKLLLRISKSIDNQAHTFAATAFCSLSAVYIFSLDMYSLARETSNEMPGYFKPLSYGFFLITIVFSFFSFLFDICGIIMSIIAIIRPDINPCNYWPIFLCISSTILQLSFHFPNILIAWSIDALYASSIALYYGIVFFLYQFSFECAFLVPHYLKWNNKKRWIICLYTIAFVFVTGTLATITIFIVHIPIHHSIEESMSGVTAIYNGVVLLIGALIAYKVRALLLDGTQENNTQCHTPPPNGM